MITAYARIALNVDYTAVPDGSRNVNAFEHTTVSGEGETWEQAQAACVIPDDAQVMSCRSGGYVDRPRRARSRRALRVGRST